MKNIIKNILLTVLIASLSFSTNSSAANPANFTMSQSATSVAINSSLTVSLYENGDNVSVVTSKISFDSTKLQLTSSVCSEQLPNKITEANGITCYVNPGAVVNGNNLAAVFTFKALSGSGSTGVSIIDGSKIAANGVNIWDKINKSVNVVFTTPDPAPAPKPTPAPVVSPKPTVTKTNPAVTSSSTPITQPIEEKVAAVDAKSNQTQDKSDDNDNGQTLGASESISIKPDNNTFIASLSIVLAVMLAIACVYMVNNYMTTNKASKAKKVATKKTAKPVAKASKRKKSKKTKRQKNI